MVGRTLGHYEIIEPLGAGGRAKSIWPRILPLDRQVAIKVLPDDFVDDPTQLKRFGRVAILSRERIVDDESFVNLHARGEELHRPIGPGETNVCLIGSRVTQLTTSWLIGARLNY